MAPVSGGVLRLDSHRLDDGTESIWHDVDRDREERPVGGIGTLTRRLGGFVGPQARNESGAVRTRLAWGRLFPDRRRGRQAPRRGARWEGCAGVRALVRETCDLARFTSVGSGYADGKTIFAVGNFGHGASAGPKARNDKGGKAWNGLDEILPDGYKSIGNCPSIRCGVDARGPTDSGAWRRGLA